ASLDNRRATPEPRCGEGTSANVDNSYPVPVNPNAGCTDRGPCQSRLIPGSGRSTLSLYPVLVLPGAHVPASRVQRRNYDVPQYPCVPPARHGVGTRITGSGDFDKNPGTQPRVGL